MGPNSFRNLTYLAVLAVVGALVYLIYQSSKKKRESRNPSIESAAGLGGYPDSLSSIAGASTATLPSSAAMAGDTVREAVDGTLLSSPAGVKGSPSTSLAASDVKDVTVNDPGSIAGSTKGGASGTSGAATGGKPRSPATISKGGGAATGAGGGKPTIAKFNAGDGKGEYMVVAGAFSSKDNAEALVAKLKKLGFGGSEAVKLENSASTYAVAGYYSFKGGADAAVRTLKVNKIESYAKKRSGVVYKPSAPPAKPAAKPAAGKPAAKPAAPASAPKPS
jgi:hypothetical protein